MRVRKVIDLTTMGLVDRRLWENRRADPAAIEAELRRRKGRGRLMPQDQRLLCRKGTCSGPSGVLYSTQQHPQGGR